MWQGCGRAVFVGGWAVWASHVMKKMSSTPVSLEIAWMSSLLLSSVWPHIHARVPCESQPLMKRKVKPFMKQWPHVRAVHCVNSHNR